MDPLDPVLGPGFGEILVIADTEGEAEALAADAVPEPGTLLLLGSGLAGLAGYGKLRFRRRKRAK